MNKERIIDPAIHRLLYNNDCVVLPNFGGFVGVYYPAQIHPKGRGISPPGKTVSFNSKLQNNDGLLAHEIANDQGISFAEAMSIIQKEVQSGKLLLEESNRLEIAGVGVIYIDRDQRYRFVPDEKANFLKSSFGLETVYAEPKQKIKAEPLTEIKISSKPSKKRRWVAAILIPVLLAGAYVVNMSIQKGNFTAASLNPFAPTEIVDCNFEPREVAKAIPIVEEQSLKSRAQESDKEEIQWILSEESEAQPLTVILPLKEEAAAVEIKTGTVAARSAEVLEDYSAQGWFVVGGAFQEYTNAQKLVRQLRADGHESFIFGKSGSLHLVCIERYENRADAKAGLSKIKSQGKTAAWIKRK